MRNLCLILLLLPSLCFAQVPGITTSSILRYREGNNYFDRPVSDLKTAILPSGTTHYTLRYDGSDWVSSALLRNDGSNLGVNAAPSSAALLRIKQVGNTDGIELERDTDTRKLQIFQDGNATIQSTSGNLDIKATSGQLSLYGPGGGSFITQIFLSAQSNVTIASGNSGLLRFSSTYAPTAAGGDYAFMKFLPTVNQTSAANQTVFGVDMNPTLTSVLGEWMSFRSNPYVGRFLYQPNAPTVVTSHIAGSIGIGANTTTPGAKLDLKSDGTSSGTFAFKVANSLDSIILVARDDRKVGINKDAPVEALDVNGQGRFDAVDIRAWTGSSNTTVGQVQFEDPASGDSEFLSYGAGERRFPVLPYSIQLQAVDYNVDWTTGRTKAFYTVPARFNGWKISKFYLHVSSIGSTTGNEIEIEKGGSALTTVTINEAVETVTLDTALATDDIITFDITSLGATATKGLLIEIEIRYQ